MMQYNLPITWKMNEEYNDDLLNSTGPEEAKYERSGQEVHLHLWRGIVIVTAQLQCAKTHSEMQSMSLLGGSGGMPPQEILKNYILRYAISVHFTMNIDHFYIIIVILYVRV